MRIRRRARSMCFWMRRLKRKRRKKQRRIRRINKLRRIKISKRKQQRKQPRKQIRIRIRKTNPNKEGGEPEFDGGEEERGRGAHNSSKSGDRRDRSAHSDKPRRRGEDRKDEVEESPEYQEWYKNNNNSISKIIVNTFPKYFLFFAFCVGFTASRAPTGFAVGLTYSMVLCRIVQVYSYYYYNKIAIIGSIVICGVISIMLIFTGLVHQY